MTSTVIPDSEKNLSLAELQPTPAPEKSLPLPELQPESLPCATNIELSTCAQGPPPPPSQTYPEDTISPKNMQETPQQPQVVYVTQTPSPEPRIAFGPTSTIMTCPFCRASISTRVKLSPTPATHLWACLLCICCCWCCVYLPYCMRTCQNSDHYCPNCHVYLGTYHI